jgi:hypothetical protein
MDIPRPQEYETTNDPLSWLEAMALGTLTSCDLQAAHLNPRDKLIGDWCLAGDLGFIFAPRGVGKTWLGMYFAKCLATGKDCGPWKIHAKASVLYLDGEMPAADVKTRDFALGESNLNLAYINHEILFERTSKSMNLADTDFQSATIQFCKQTGRSILFLDNLSTLTSGVDENKAIDWERILPWLLRLRREQITVIFIHHAGRSGQMRGHSKREDPSAWIISLSSPANDPNNAILGAHFISSFTKWRNAPRKPASLEWNFTPMPDNEILVRHEVTEPIDVFRFLIESGIHDGKELAEEMNLSRGRITQLAKQAEKAGWLEIKKGGKYYLKYDKDTWSEPD